MLICDFPHLTMFFVENVSIVAVLVATFCSMLLGMIWYNPHVFGTYWMQLTGIKDNKNMGSSMATGLVATFISCYFLAVLLAISGTNTIMDAAFMAGIVWLAGSMPVQLHSVAWEKTPINLFALNAAQSLVSLMIAAAVLQQWPG
mgnify:CR=1 FL=1|jgi:hypothetical protein